MADGKRTIRNLRCALNDAELLERGQSLGSALAEVERLEAELDSAKQSYNGKIQSEDGRAKLLQRAVIEKAEWRDVGCTWVYYYTDGKKRLYREDTGEMVEEAPISDVEIQSLLDLGEDLGEQRGRLVPFGQDGES